MSKINNTKVRIKRKIAAIFAGTMLVIPAAMPASASVLNTNGQHLTGGQQSALLLAGKENTVKGGESTVAKPSNNKTNKWHLDKKGARFNQLTPVEQQNFDKFQNAINQGLSPKEAAQKVGDAKYTKLKGTKNQYEIRLSGKARATFLVNDKDHVVKLLQVGGHT